MAEQEEEEELEGTGTHRDHAAGSRQPCAAITMPGASRSGLELHVCRVVLGMGILHRLRLLEMGLGPCPCPCQTQLLSFVGSPWGRTASVQLGTPRSLEERWPARNSCCRTGCTWQGKGVTGSRPPHARSCHLGGWHRGPPPAKPCSPHLAQQWLSPNQQRPLAQRLPRQRSRRAQRRAPGTPALGAAPQLQPLYPTRAPSAAAKSQRRRGTQPRGRALRAPRRRRHPPATSSPQPRQEPRGSRGQLGESRRR